MRCLILPLAVLVLASPARGQFLDRVPTARVVELADDDAPFAGVSCYSQSYQSSYLATSQSYTLQAPLPQVNYQAVRPMVFQSSMPVYGVQAIRPGTALFGGRSRFRSSVRVRSRGFAACGPGGCP